MRLRSLWPLLLPLFLVLLAIGCSGDDGTTATTTGSSTPTATAGNVTPTQQLLVSPGRTKPATADHYALRLSDVVTFLQQTLGTAAPVRQPCTYEAADAIIDCSSQGFGKIALDPPPTGSNQWDCAALLTPERTLFGANCVNAVSGNPVTFIYKIQD